MTQASTLPNSSGKDVVEEFAIQGEQLTNAIQRILHEGNIRRILITRQGQVLMELPFTFGLLIAGFAPAVAIPGLIGLVLTGYNIEIVRVKDQVAVKTTIAVEQSPVKPEPSRPATPAKNTQQVLPQK